MANYDEPTAVYDGGLFYDAAPLPQPRKRMAKIKVKLNLREKSDSELLLFAQQHASAMNGNANFTTPLPPATEFTPVLTAFQTTLGDFNTAQQAAKQATTEKDTARQALEAILAQRGNYVELTAASAADGVAVVESAGFSVKTSSAATTPPAQVQNLSLTASDSAGELDAQWDPLPRVKSYEIEISPDPITPTSWSPRPGVPNSKAMLTGLVSGARVWVRVRALGAGGQGPWSDPATKIVP